MPRYKVKGRVVYTEVVEVTAESADKAADQVEEGEGEVKDLIREGPFPGASVSTQEVGL